MKLFTRKNKFWEENFNRKFHNVLVWKMEVKFSRGKAKFPKNDLHKGNTNIEGKRFGAKLIDHA